ncbi:MAG: hypothetical protein P4L53_21720 [Candidatus Obscuribacterales bacterium]|nr:hypothetical protein [Candidatus Obscuribacterales bacterium]
MKSTSTSSKGPLMPFSEKRKKRSERGSFIAENAAITVAIWIGFVIPFINLSTVGLRYSILMRAVHDGAHTASGCTSFSSGSGTRAVMDYAPQQVLTSLAQTPGVNVLSDNVTIITTPFATNVPVLNTANKPLPSTVTIDTTANVYTIQLTVNATVAPLMQAAASGIIPAIPGLTSPMNVTVGSQEISENPSGLVN